jgi:hypothetical protein
MELVAEAAEDGQTEVTVVLPRRGFESYWRRILHDRTADHIAALVSEIPNANATIIPFPLGKRRRALVPWAAGGDAVAAMRAEAPEQRPGRRGRAPEERSGRDGQTPVPAHPWGTGAAGTGSQRWVDRRADARRGGRPAERGGERPGEAPGTTPIAALQPRQRARVTGRVRSVRVQAGAGVPSIECTIADSTGQLMLIFQGRRRVPGIEPGARITVEGMVGERGRRVAMINPLLTILRTAEGTS